LSALAATVWSLTSPGLRYLLITYNTHPLALAFWRDAFIAVACLLTLLLLRPSMLRVSLRDLRGFAMAGAVSIGIYHALWLWSVALNGAAVAVVLIYLFPTFVSIGARLLFREPLRWPHVIALVVSLAGCLLLVRAYDPALFRVSWLGAVVGVGTAMAHSVYVLFSQRSVESHSPWTSLTYTMLFGAIVLLGLSLALAPLPSLVIGTASAPWLITLAIALGPTLGGYAIFTLALRYVSGKVASLIVVLEVPISALLALWLLGEQLAWPQFVGMGLILLSIVIPRFMTRTGARPLPIDDRARVVSDLG
jgi:drug/metabolite transporter (DMT)-like permease